MWRETLSSLGNHSIEFNWCGNDYLCTKNSVALFIFRCQSYIVTGGTSTLRSVNSGTWTQIFLAQHAQSDSVQVIDLVIAKRSTSLPSKTLWLLSQYALGHCSTAPAIQWVVTHLAENEQINTFPKSELFSVVTSSIMTSETVPLAVAYVHPTLHETTEQPIVPLLLVPSKVGSTYSV